MAFEVEPGSILDGVPQTLWYIIHELQQKIKQN